MNDKLEQIADIIEFSSDTAKDQAQQILDSCQPQWTPVEQNPYDLYQDKETRSRVIFRFFNGKDYWTLEPPPPEDKP